MNHQSQHRLAASPALVYQALSTQQGLRGWWTQTCEADHTVGGRATFRFGQCRKMMEIESRVPGQEVRWHLRGGAHRGASGVDRPDEWGGTHMVFKLTPQDNGQTLRAFEHIGLTPSLQCYEICHRS